LGVLFEEAQSMLLELMLLVTLKHGQVGQQQSIADMAALEAKAQAGDTNAQVELGQAYEEGHGVKQSDEEAAKWYLEAAKHGNPTAQVDIGILLWTGRGVAQDKAQAVEWYQKAAKLGNGSAMFNLGTAYYNGEGVPSDGLQALAWFLLAEDHGSVAATDAVRRYRETPKPNEFNQAYLRIGKMFLLGGPLKQDYVEAVRWYTKAAENGDSTAAVEVAAVIAKGTGDYNAALRWCQFAADQGNGVGMYCIGWLYQEGKLGPKDSATAAQWYQKGAAHWNAQSCFRLGRMFWNADGVASDKVAAYKWALVASKVFPEAKQDALTYQAAMNKKEIHKGEEAAKQYLTYVKFGSEMRW
jgi:TPR repeat protein